MANVRSYRRKTKSGKIITVKAHNKKQRQKQQLRQAISRGSILAYSKRGSALTRKAVKKGNHKRADKLAGAGRRWGVTKINANRSRLSLNSKGKRIRVSRTYHK